VTDDGQRAGHVRDGACDGDTLLLLQIAEDEGLRFYYLDAGVIQFRIPPGALAERDWSQVVAIADSS